MAKKKVDKLAFPKTLYVEMQEDSDSNIYPLTHDTLAGAAAGNDEPVTIGTYELVTTQKVRATFEIV
jgi:hypothetical protein